MQTLRLTRFARAHAASLGPPRTRLQPRSLAAMAQADVQSYIETHGLQKTVEDVLNGTVKSKPDEPLSFMVRGLIRRAAAAWQTGSATGRIRMRHGRASAAAGGGCAAGRAPGRQKRRSALATAQQRIGRAAGQQARRWQCIAPRSADQRCARHRPSRG